MRHSTRDRNPFRVRLACVKHAASVRSEPGSNSPVWYPELTLQSVTYIVLTYIRASLWITKITLKCPTPEKGISTFTKLKISKVLKDTSGPFAVFCYSVFKDRFSPKAAWQTPRMPRRLLRRDAQSIFFPALCQYCFTASHSSLFIPSLSTFPQSSSLPKTAANYTILKGLSTRKNTFGTKHFLFHFRIIPMCLTLRWKMIFS